MKKILFVTLALAFAFVILIISIIKISVPVSAQNNEAISGVNYPLPYPGILPDHPLYPIKMVRDRIWLFLTNDSVQKTKLLLHFADKRINSAKALLEKEKLDLAITTASKAEKYLEKTFDQLEKLKDENQREQIRSTMSTTLLKHEEILEALKERVEPEKETLVESLFEYPYKIRVKINKPDSEEPKE